MNPTVAFLAESIRALRLSNEEAINFVMAANHRGVITTDEAKTLLDMAPDAEIPPVKRPPTLRIVRTRRT